MGVLGILVSLALLMWLAYRGVTVLVLAPLLALLAVLAVVLACALLTYGGVSVFVVVFAAYPIAARLFRRQTIPSA